MLNFRFYAFLTYDIVSEYTCAYMMLFLSIYRIVAVYVNIDYARNTK